eukprot:TRINITY_DN1202_c0_g1_i1.p1 TRINITY_DN1202_c0_g1~~TRINITY_DN1202_c0_g1_i1.p1  ORF type:complete len:273 (+),score=65.29 TRINITY_DN1202_c0_g1_i1:40-858(+)
MVTVNNHHVEHVMYDKDRKYVESSKGMVPIILTAPHGGYLGFHDVPCRQRELPSTCVLPDTMTAELLDDIVMFLKANNVSVYMVKGLIHRKYCDLNRPPDEAYEGPEMEAYYRDYHTTIEGYIDEIAAVHGRVPLLLDVHGQGYMLLCVIRGTLDGATCARHLDIHGDDFLTGKQSLFGCLDAREIDVDPPVGHPLTAYPLELTVFNGGYTTQRYSGVGYTDVVLSKPYTHQISCIQLETGAFQRKDRAVTTAFASKVADAIKEFGTTYDLL